MTHRLGVALFWLCALAAVALLAVAATMLANDVPDARGGALVLGVIAAVVLILGAGLRFVLGWRKG